MNAIFLSKQDLRKEKKKEREKITLLDLRENYSQCIMERIAKEIKKKNWTKIMLYYPLKNEVNCLNILPLLKGTLHHFEIFFPQIDKKNMIAKKVNVLDDGTLDMDQFEKEENFGILQPKKNSKNKAQEHKKIDVIITPALAFDPYGNRVGYGKGYYDNFIAKLSEIKSIGALYSCQETEKIPREKHDTLLNAVSTEKKWHNFSF